MTRPAILIALDAPGAADSMARYLRLEGFDCTVAAQAEARSRLDSGRFRAAVVEWAGGDLAGDGGAAPPQTPVVALVSEGRRADALRGGAAAALEKPYHLATVAARLREIAPEAGPPDQ